MPGKGVTGSPGRQQGSCLLEFALQVGAGEKVADAVVRLLNIVTPTMRRPAVRAEWSLACEPVGLGAAESTRGIDVRVGARRGRRAQQALRIVFVARRVPVAPGAIHCGVRPLPTGWEETVRAERTYIFP